MNINQIAKIAKVSKRTVTRAINNQYGISEKTKEKILNIIKRHNYRPSSIARALSTKKTKVLGLIIPENEDPFFARLIKAVEEVADKNSYSIILMNTFKDYKKELKNISLCIEKQVDGILFTPTRTDNKKSILELKNSKIPFVCMNRHFDDKKIDYVINDNILGGYLATNHLLEHGYKKIAYLSYSMNISSAKERLQGYKKALRKHKIPFNKKYVIETGGMTEEVQKTCKKLLKLKKTPDAIFTFCDLIAVGVYRFLKGNGLRAGKDMGLVGYDDIDIVSLLDVPLTTICQPTYEIGRLSTEILINKLIKKKKTKQIILKPSLIVRASCGCKISS
jgi:LacI family transcriptional regulator